MHLFWGTILLILGALTSLAGGTTALVVFASLWALVTFVEIMGAMDHHRRGGLFVLPLSGIPGIFGTIFGGTAGLVVYFAILTMYLLALIFFWRRTPKAPKAVAAKGGSQKAPKPPAGGSKEAPKRPAGDSKAVSKPSADEFKEAMKRAGGAGESKGGSPEKGKEHRKQMIE
ncbi:MAG: hypothetical protein HXX08_09750 [Chloroflexi bacterium]|uniref:Uncharacterized protein n=1 Tax=Candidatus Chlorohelix allophototropha TaxID=3003348 RepID=A0A8T7M1X4_9CHLR|nr:hypothetical protein [Chloroflexota bacterium]WJW65528.1 hypothetical protein OZ401_001294 [Chloroflexota bacterium L227-S17]